MCGRWLRTDVHAESAAANFGDELVTLHEREHLALLLLRHRQAFLGGALKSAAARLGVETEGGRGGRDKGET